MNQGKYVYLDYAATTPMDPRVIEEIKKHFKETYGNPSSLHTIGQHAAKTLYNSRTFISSLINANRNDIYFTSSGTEADNLAIKGVTSKNKERGNHIITSTIEHHAVELPCKELERAGILSVHICTIIPISQTVGANRIVPAVAIPHPLGDPTKSESEEKLLRRSLIEKALDALKTKIEDQTVF